MTTARCAVRVAFDARFIDDRYHGVGRYAYHLLDTMARLSPGDTFVTIHDPRRPSTRLSLAPILALPNVVPCPLPVGIYAPHEQPALALALLRGRADVCLVPYFPAPLFAPCPIVTTVHDLIFDLESRYRAGRWVRYYYRPMMWLAARRAARIIVVSESTARDLRAIYGADPRKVVVALEAAAPQFKPVTNPTVLDYVRRRHGLPDRFIMALSVRRPHKNLAALVEAYGRIAARVPHDLVLVGETHGRYEDGVPAAIERLGLRSRIHELGWVPDSDTPALYSLAEIFAMPSLLEGFGLPPLEAMSCGTAVAASNASSLPEVVADCGLLFDPHDVSDIASALERLATEDVLRHDLAARGLARTSEFTWERTASIVLSTLRIVTRS
jgi:glycosyltransferase involved in cell wall biosynthesis